MIWFALGIVFVGVPVYALIVAARRADEFARRLEDVERAECYYHGNNSHANQEASRRVRERTESE